MQNHTTNGLQKKEKAPLQRPCNQGGKGGIANNEPLAHNNKPGKNPIVDSAKISRSTTLDPQSLQKVQRGEKTKARIPPKGIRSWFPTRTGKIVGKAGYLSHNYGKVKKKKLGVPRKVCRGLAPDCTSEISLREIS